MNAKLIIEKFKEEFNQDPFVFRSPGRINLIGEHTDYNEGFVLPAAIDKEIVLAIYPSRSKHCTFVSIDMNDSIEFEIENIEYSNKNWPNYLLGVVDQLRKLGLKLSGFNLVFGGNIPIGAGLSSSAAIEGGLAFALNQIFDLKLEKLDLVKIAQKAENEFVGVKCGIMDQYINIFGANNKVLKIDCRSLDYEYVPINLEGIKIVLLDTQVNHKLDTSEYNLRREQCEEGIRILKKYDPGIKSLRDVDSEFLNSHKNKLAEIIFKRCSYVIKENKRLLDGCKNLYENNIYEFGNKMFQSHYGLRDEYEVSCKELDLLVSIAESHPGVIGARMMGGGFGGCTINLVKENDITDLINESSKTYKDKTGIDLKSYICSIEEGTSIVNQVEVTSS